MKKSSPRKWSGTMLATAGALALGLLAGAGDGTAAGAQTASRTATVEDWAAKMKPLLRMDDGTPIATVAAWRAHREEILKRTLSGWGKAPASRPPLVIERLGSVDCGTYIRHTLAFLSEPDDRVKAYLCLPKNAKGKVPGVLAIHSTTPLGKDQPAGLGGVASRHIGKELAERGYAVLMPDEIVAGERLLGATTTWDTAPFYARHPEWSALGKAVWDSRLFIDVLCAQPEVDTERIASIGHSQGAIYTVLTAAFDERVKAGIASCGYWPHFGDIAREGAEGRGRWVRPKGWVGTPHMRDLFEAGEPFPYDWHELAACASPRALFFHLARGDYGAVPEAIEASLIEIGKVNRLLGSPENHLHPVWSPGGHDFPDWVRAKAYEWLEEIFRTKN